MRGSFFGQIQPQLARLQLKLDSISLLNRIDLNLESEYPRPSFFFVKKLIFHVSGALLGAAAAAAPGAGTASSGVSDAAVEQLRQMGITDEEVARRALEATGGDIRAALDLIFGDGLMF